MEKPYINKAEQNFKESLGSEGWEVTKRGWPDFLCIRGGEVMCVEVKQKGNHRLRETQKRVMKVLMAAGIPCYRWDPDKGLSELNDNHADILPKVRKVIGEKRSEQGRAQTYQDLLKIGKNRGYPYPERWAKCIIDGRRSKEDAKMKALKDKGIV